MYNITAKETQPTSWLHLNGTPDQILDRLCVSELIKGWPVYRDASEWHNLRDCFARDAYVFTSEPPTHPNRGPGTTARDEAKEEQQHGPAAPPSTPSSPSLRNPEQPETSSNTARPAPQ